MKNFLKIVLASTCLLASAFSRGAVVTADTSTTEADDLIRNWIAEPTNSVVGAGAAGFRSKLNLARQARLETNMAESVKLLVSILEAPAPEQYKRVALLELSTVAQQEKQLPRALQILAQYVRRYPEDTSVPAVLLRQGLICRQMGAYQMALAKFYGVMTTALNLKLDRFQQYQRLVLQAQVEIAETHNLRGNHVEAADCYSRLLTQDASGLNKAQIQFKLIRCLTLLGRDDEVVAQAQDFLARYPDEVEQPEVRFLMICSFKHLQRNNEAIHQVLLLLQAEQATAGQEPERWAYWQQRAGNEIANQLYLQGDYVNALEIYQRLAELGQSPAWKWQALYQVGLTYERLQQPQKAIETYDRILLALNEETNSPIQAGVQTVLDMAKWRKEYLAWLSQAEQARQTINRSHPPVSSSLLR
jgi:tetratricopeptide (TPR) repeat protein